MRARAVQRPGFFGKLPIVGDFVSRRLPREFIDSWDNWLIGGLAMADENMRYGRPDSRLFGPIWRFSLTPGICGPNAWLGLLAPSADRVGRYFPLTIAVPVQNTQYLTHYFNSNEEWFDQIEALALSAAQDPLTLEEFDFRLQRLTQPFRDECLMSTHQITKISNSRGESNLRIDMDTNEQLPQALASLGGQLIADQAPGYSLWCARRTQLSGASLLVFDGLPSSNDIAKSLIGEREQYASNADFELSSHPCKKTADEGIAPKSVSMGETLDENSEPRHQKLSNNFHWDSASLSNAGNGNSDNQNVVLEKPKIGIWAIADCVDGQQGGNIAGEMFIDALDRLEAAANIDDLIRDATEALRSVNADLGQQVEQGCREEFAGGSVAVLLADGNRCAHLRASACRVYLYRGARLTQLTPDHSAGLSDVESNLSGLLGDNEPHTKKRTKRTGAAEQFDLDTDIRDIEDQDIFLLCSHTLVTTVSPQEIETILARDDCRVGAQNLVDLAVKRGARDNVSFILARAFAAD